MQFIRRHFGSRLLESTPKNKDKSIQHSSILTGFAFAVGSFRCLLKPTPKGQSHRGYPPLCLFPNGWFGEAARAVNQPVICIYGPPGPKTRHRSLHSHRRGRPSRCCVTPESSRSALWEGRTHLLFSPLLLGASSGSPRRWDKRNSTLLSAHARALRTEGLLISLR